MTGSPGRCGRSLGSITEATRPRGKMSTCSDVRAFLYQSTCLGSQILWLDLIDKQQEVRQTALLHPFSEQRDEVRAQFLCALVGAFIAEDAVQGGRGSSCEAGIREEDAEN